MYRVRHLHGHPGRGHGAHKPAGPESERPPGTWKQVCLSLNTSSLLVIYAWTQESSSVRKTNTRPYIFLAVLPARQRWLLIAPACPCKSGDDILLNDRLAGQTAGTDGNCHQVLHCRPQQRKLPVFPFIIVARIKIDPDPAIAINFKGIILL